MRSLIGTAVTIATVIGAVSVHPVLASTYDVTHNGCSGAGSLSAAVAAAAASPGADVINIAPGLEIDLTTCAIATNDWLLDIPESLTLIGNGSRVVGRNEWVTSSGQVSPVEAVCPKDHPTDIIVAHTGGLFRIGTFRSDNSAIHVVVNDLELRGFAAVAQVNRGASLTLDGVDVSGLRPITHCDNSAIEAYTGADVTIRNSDWSDNWNWADVVRDVAFSGMIAGGSDTFNSDAPAGTLLIERSTFADSGRAGFISWHGRTQIVSSIMDHVGGFSNLGPTALVNSLWSGDDVTQIAANSADRLVIDGADPFVAVGSTMLFPSPGTGNAAILALGSGGVQLRSSVIGVSFPDLPGALIGTSGQTPAPTLDADDATYVMPVADQDAGQLRTLLGAPGLRTDPPALPASLLADTVTRATPLIASGSTPGVLLDTVPDTACPDGVNRMINPSDLSCITHDVLGANRYDGNGARDSGAIQVSRSATHLTVTRVASSVVDLAWHRPQDPLSGAITGYAVRFRPAGSAGPYTQLEVTDPATTSATVTGLTNGTTYEFLVVGVNGAGDGSPSNIVTATPFDAPGTTTVVLAPGDQSLTASWVEPSSGGHPGAPTYTVVLVDQVTGAVTIRRMLSARVAVFTGLVNGRNYTVTAFATFSDGTSSRAGSANGLPMGPIRFGLPVTRGIAGGIGVSWPLPDTGGHSVTSYTVAVQRPAGVAVRTISTTQTSATLTGLLPGRSYRVCVVARMVDGAVSSPSCRNQVAGIRMSTVGRVSFPAVSTFISGAQRSSLLRVLPADRGSIASVNVVGYVQRARTDNPAFAHLLSLLRASVTGTMLRRNGVVAPMTLSGAGVGGTTASWRVALVTLVWYR